MPLYEYRCQDCQQRFDVRRSFADADSPAPCPSCQSQRTRRLLSTFVAMTASSAGGTATRVAGTGGGCSGCAGGSCATCGR